MTSIFVGNLSWQTTESELRTTFERYGRVSTVKLMTDRNTGSPRGFGFVNMPSMEDAEEAIFRLKGTSLGGRSLTINEARRGGDSAPPAPTTGRRSTLLDLL